MMFEHQMAEQAAVLDAGLRSPVEPVGLRKILPQFRDPAVKRAAVNGPSMKLSCLNIISA